MARTTSKRQDVERACIGFRHREGRCGRAADLELNSAGLWCSNCERARRWRLTRQMEAITAAFENSGLS